MMMRWVEIAVVVLCTLGAVRLLDYFTKKEEKK